MNWIQERNVLESLEILRTLSDCCSKLGGNLSKQLNQFAQTDYTVLMSYEIDYKTFERDSSYDIIDAIYARQILALFQKSQFLPYCEGWDKSKTAADRFVAAEAKCLWTNRRLQYAAAKPQKTGVGVASMMHIAQYKIACVLGDLPSLDSLPFAFGSGANTNVKSSHASPRVKLGATLECSSNLSPTVGEFLSETPHWTSLHDLKLSNDTFIVNIDVVPGKVMFVPKNAKTDRSISLEPLLNGFFQKGFGSYIRDRLGRFNINLRDQTRNQMLAKRGSEANDLSTLDLSMASDCMSRELVWSLLPYDWAEMLDRLRTGTVILPKIIDKSMIDGYNMGDYMDSSVPYELQKFSSMGNGFTFELESLIFYGLCYAACKHSNVDVTEIGVYGDDLIVPTGATESLIELLEHCGFSLNIEKSFSAGAFRESCGADYLSGFDIRPFYQKTLISDRTLFTMHNWFLRNGEIELANIAKSFVNPFNAIYGPDGFGDGHLIGSHCLRRNRKIARSGWAGGYFDTYVLKPLSFSKLMPGDAVLPTYSVYTRSGKDNPTEPNRIRGSKGYAKVSIYTLESNIFSRKH